MRLLLRLKDKRACGASGSTYIVRHSLDNYGRINGDDDFIQYVLG